MAILQEMLRQREAMGDNLEALCTMQPAGTVKKTMKQALKSAALSCSVPPEELVQKLALVPVQPARDGDLGDALGGTVIPGATKAKKPSSPSRPYLCGRRQYTTG